MNRKEKVAYLEDMAKQLRKTALTMIHTAHSGHPGGSLSAADIVAALYFGEMHIKPDNPEWEERDRFVLSKGHVCPILYSALILKGYMDKDEVFTLRKMGSRLQGHPDMKRTPGIDISTGSLGQGVSCAVGMAIGLKRDDSPARVFTLVGDGECDEGVVWEAAETAAKYQLDNLVVFVDNNNIQNDGFCRDIMPTLDLEEKFKAFGFDTARINGHSMVQIVEAIDNIRGARNGKPKAIVCNTVKGRGVSFMENVPAWHGVAPNDDQYQAAMKELEEGLQ
ncbi:MAG: transketolase [Sphaerochaetaceae bacterium]